MSDILIAQYDGGAVEALAARVAELEAQWAAIPWDILREMVGDTADWPITDDGYIAAKWIEDNRP